MIASIIFDGQVQEDSGMLPSLFIRSPLPASSSSHSNLYLHYFYGGTSPLIARKKELANGMTRSMLPLYSLKHGENFHRVPKKFSLPITEHEPVSCIRFFQFVQSFFYFGSAPNYVRVKELVYVNVRLSQGLGRKAILLAIMRHEFLLSWGGGSPLSSGPFFSRPRCSLRKASREYMESNIPSRVSRDLRRNLPLVPSPCQAFIQYSIN